MSASDPIGGPLPPAPRSATKTALIAGFVLLLTFAAGVIVGGAVEHHLRAIRRGGPLGAFPPHAVAAHLNRRLDLSDAQYKQVEQIIRAHHEQMVTIFGAVRPQIDAEIAQANREISAVLTPEQRAKFEKLKMRLGPHKHP
ncbi:MAG TPA: hypothetical protein VF824_06325 [Thermoanaerobaculia bacterium]